MQCKHMYPPRGTRVFQQLNDSLQGKSLFVFLQKQVLILTPKRHLLMKAKLFPLVYVFFPG